MKRMKYQYKCHGNRLIEHLQISDGRHHITRIPWMVKLEDVITDANSASNEYIPPMMDSPPLEDEDDCEACAI